VLDVLRWGRTDYETDTSLALERRGASDLGLSWALEPGFAPTAALGEARAIVVPSRVRVDASVVARFPGDLVVATTSGYDHVDLDACRARGVAVVRLPEARRDAVVEHALGSLIALMRRLPDLDRRARDGVWARAELPALAPTGIDGATIAVVGLGVIGRRMAQVLGALGARVLGVDPDVRLPGVERVDLHTALAAADAVTLHCSLTPTSRGLVGADALDRLRPHAVVVNTSRGEVLDVETAVARVRDGRLRGLACDVFPVEPYARLAATADLPAVWFTPHSAGYTADLGERVADGVSRALAAWVRGEDLPHRVV